MQLFEAGRVHFVEGEPGFCEETALSHQRGEQVLQTVQAKTENLLRLVAAVEISLPDWSEAQLADEALQEFGYTPDLNQALRNELSVVMREAGACEWTLDDYFWHPGIRPARTVLRRRMLSAAIEKFPHLDAPALSWAKKEKGNAEIQINMVLV